MKLLMKKSKPTENKSGDKLEYFRKLLLDHLDTLGEPMNKGGKGLPVGTIRDRKDGKKYVKIAPGKWRPKYDTQSRGAKMAIAAIRRKVSAAKDAHEMMQIILENRDRFSDKEGHPLPFVQELHNYIMSTQDQREKEGKAKDKAAAGKKKKADKEKPEGTSAPETDKEPAPDKGKKKEGKAPKEWKNPLEKYTDIDPGVIARTAANFKKHDGLTEERVVSSMTAKHGLTEEDAKAFWNYLDNLTPAEIKRAKDFADNKAAEDMMKAESPEIKKWLKNYEDVKGNVPKEEFDKPKTYGGHKRIELKNPPAWEGGGSYYLLESSFGKKDWNLVRETKPPATKEGAFQSAKMDFLFTGDLQTCKEILQRLAIGARTPEKEPEEPPAQAPEEKGKSPGYTEAAREIDYIFSTWLNGTIKGEMFHSKTEDGNEIWEVNVNKGHSDKIRGAIREWEGRGFFAKHNEEGGYIQFGTKSLDDAEEPEETEDEKHRNRSEAMKGNQNAKKDGAEPQAEAELKAEEEETTKARARAGMPPIEKHGRSSTMKDSTWDPKSKDYRYRDTGYIAGSRKELAQSYIRQMAKDGAQVTNETIDWTGLEENDIAAAEIITKQNLMGKPDWESLQANGLTGNAGYLINEIYKTINSKPDKATAENRYNFSRGLDAIRGRLEACKTLDEVKAVVGDIQGEITGNYLSSKNTPEYLDLAQKRQAVQDKIKAFQGKLKEKIYEQGDPFLEADAFLKNKMGILSGVTALINPDNGSWKGSYYDIKGKKELQELLHKADEEYKRRQAAIEERSGISVRDLADQLNELDKKMRQAESAKNEELRLSNDMNKAWETFGKSFKKSIQVVAHLSDVHADGWLRRYAKNETFAKHYKRAGELAPDDFSWSEKKATGGGGGPRKTQFELKVSDHIVRKGGRGLTVDSTDSLKKMFNLRDVQSGNWVLNDVKSAKFHVENIAMGLADLADITGISDDLVSLNGRLAIAIGARGHSKALAHYEPVERVINITKMKGGGSLGHEWFHAFDNLLADAMTGGRYNVFLTENGQYDDLTARQRKLLDRVITYKRWVDTAQNDYYRKSYTKTYEEAKEAAKKAGIKIDELDEVEPHIAAVKSAFSKLATTMMTGTATKTEYIYYTKDDHAYITSDAGKRMLADLHVSKETMDFDEALEKISRYHRVYGKKPEQLKRLIAAYYEGNAGGGGLSAKTKEKTSNFYESAKKLESNPEKPYWSSILEMGARAFSAYLNDKMADRGWENNYLAHATENSMYDSRSPYPAGEEREAINAAFDQLFQAINETKAIRKAIDRENAERIDPESSGMVHKAIDGALRFFSGLQKGRGSFDRKKVVLNRAGETVEEYRWIAEAPHAEVVQALQAGVEAAEDNPDTVDLLNTDQKTIAIDFDGVINSFSSGWEGPTATDEPVWSAAESISRLYDRGYKLVIFSTRAQTPEGANTIREYLRRHTENNELADTIEITDRKPIAHVYIDDRAIPFTGNWEETLDRIEDFKPWMEKSLTFSGHTLQGRIKVQGMDISIENKKGSTRSGTDKDGHEWNTKMHYDYGYIRGTVGVDKDHLDAYIGPSPESEIVYIVNQNDPVTGDFDEQKVMLGFNTEEEAKAAYLKQYDRPGFFGNIVKMDIDTFKDEAFNAKNKGKPLKKRAA